MSLEIVLGPMFSGKSSYALSYIRKQRAIGRNVVAVKPASDTRYSQSGEIVTHDHERIPCIAWNTETPLTPSSHFLNADCIVVEEAQFFQGLYNWVKFYVRGHHKHIVLVGLDGDAGQRGFEEFLSCIPLADKVTKRLALCHVCCDGTEAPYTRYRPGANPSGDQIDVGGAEKYQAVCLKHIDE